MIVVKKFKGTGFCDRLFQIVIHIFCNNREMSQHHNTTQHKSYIASVSLVNALYQMRAEGQIPGSLNILLLSSHSSDWNLSWWGSDCFFSVNSVDTIAEFVCIKSIRSVYTLKKTKKKTGKNVLWWCYITSGRSHTLGCVQYTCVGYKHFCSSRILWSINSLLSHF